MVFVKSAMKAVGCIGLVAYLFWPGDAPAEEVDLARPLTLADVIRVAMEYSPQVNAAARSVDAAQEGYDIARRQSLPTVNLAVSYEGFPWRDKLITPRHMDIPPTMGPDMLDLFQRQFTKNVLNFGVMWSLPLFTGGRISSEVAFASLGGEAAEFTLQQTQNDLVLALAHTYYNILRFRRLVQATQASVENLEESARIVRQALDAGKAAPVDLFRIEARLANVRQNLIRVQNAETVSEATLKVLMGLEETAGSIAIADTLAAYTPARYDLSESVRQVLVRRPEYRRQRGLMEMQRALAHKARAAYLPNISLSGGYRGVISDRNDDPIGDGMIVVTLTQAIFDEPARNRISKEKLRVQQAEAELERVRLNVVLEVQTAYLNLVEAQERVGATEAALQAARESLRIEQIKLEEGKGIVNDVLDAQADHLRSEVNYIEALADARTAEVALQRATGEIKTGP